MSRFRRRRSELAVPANNSKMVAHALGSNSDLVFLDLEDAVPESEKLTARADAIRHLMTVPRTIQVRAVRINGLDTPYGFDDIVQLVEQAGPSLDVLILPKIRSSEEVVRVGWLLDNLERRSRPDRPIGLEILIEEVEALGVVEEIAHASERVESLIFGAWDFAASQGVATLNVPSNLWDYARSRIVAAARAAGVDAIDSACVGIDDTDQLEAEAMRAALMGYVGKWAIHPRQIEILNRAFTPTADAISTAKRFCEAYDAARAEGRGAIRLDGLLVDAGSVRILKNVLDRAQNLGIL